MKADEKVNILMVDDQPAKLLSYEVILADLGENLIKATTAKEALNILLKTDVAVVLMDVSMPDLDGFELADVIRQHPRFQKTAIIFISGVHLTDADKIQGYKSGAVDYISVPVVPEVLRAKISIFVELHRKTRQLEALNTELERRVAERTEELRTRAELLDLATEAILVRDLEGQIIFWNTGAEKLYGWTREEALGQDMHKLLQTVFPRPREEIESLLREQKYWQGNLTQKTRSGAEIVVSCRKTMNHEGNAILEVSRDITRSFRPRKRCAKPKSWPPWAAWPASSPTKSTIRWPPSPTLFYLLRNHPSLDDDARHFADVAEQELQRVCHITRQTLSFYRESKQPIAVNLPEMLDDVLELQDRTLAKNRIRLSKHYLVSAGGAGLPGGAAPGVSQPDRQRHPGHARRRHSGRPPYAKRRIGPAIAAARPSP